VARNDVNGSNPIQGQQVPVASYLGQGNVDLDQYPVAHAQSLAGALRTAPTLSDRDSIGVQFRQEGMLCFVQADNNYYKLLPDLVTWELLLLGGSSIANFIRRPFVNEIQLVFNNILIPVIQIYVTDPNGLFRPLLYGDVDTALYGLNEYNQATVPAEKLWHHEKEEPEFRATYAPTQKQLTVDFQVPQSGTAVLSF
jgi:hypothetical protein